ncbi:surfactin synthase thioesterase subunit [Streptomyces sp. V4I8]|uniref:thioesterase II family protein n=1 Tax=Streptomyces sp. V4I8 TaxID=3156469 RepID=UPI0035191F76
MSVPPPWRRTLRRLSARPTGNHAIGRSICLPPAGAGAGSFHPWVSHHDQGVELWAAQLPGRGDRIHERPLEAVDEAARQVALAVQWLEGLPYVLFGHSLGALLAFEIVHLLHEQQLPPPRSLIVSGCSAPGAETRTNTPLDTDAQVIAEARRIGLPAELLADSSFAELVLPALRGDLRMFHSYVLRPRAPTTCPIAVCMGAHDPYVSAAGAHAWAAHTTRFQGVHTLPGNHDYLASTASGLSSFVCDALRLTTGHR